MSDMLCSHVRFAEVVPLLWFIVNGSHLQRLSSHYSGVADLIAARWLRTTVANPLAGDEGARYETHERRVSDMRMISMLEQCMADKKTAQVFLRNHVIAGTVLALDSEEVELRNRELSRIIVALSEIEAVAIA